MNRKVFALPTFQKALGRLWRRFPSVKKAVGHLAAQLEDGETPGDQVQNIGYTVYKVRLPNPDAQRGKRGGFRVIYYLKQADSVLLIEIYSKTDQSDIPINRIIDRIHEYESGNWLK